MAKTKADPFFARPDGKRATSAWLTKLQAAARETAEKQAGLAIDGLLPTNTLEANIALVHARSAYFGLGNMQAASAWECLLQWHGECVLEHMANRLEDRQILKLLDSFHTETAQALLLSRLSLPEVREALADRASRWPFYTLCGLLAQNPSRDQPAAQLLQRLLHAHPDWLPALQAALQAEGNEVQARTLARLLTPAEQVTEAGVDELPPLLREPPWRAGATRLELPVLELVARREPAVVHWSRWRGGTVEPRPQTRSRSRWYRIRCISFDDPTPLHDFLTAEGLVQTEAWQAFRNECASGNYASFFVGSLDRGQETLKAALHFLRSAGKLTDDDLVVLGKRDDLSCYVEGRTMSTLSLQGTYYDVEAHFHDLHSAHPPTSETARALSAQAELQWGRPGLALYLWGVKPDRIQAVLASGAVAANDLREPPQATQRLLNHLGHLDDALALSLMRQQQTLDATRPYYEVADPPDTCLNPVARLLKRFGAEHIDLVFAFMPPMTATNTQAIMEIVDWDSLAIQLSRHVFAKSSKLRAFARNWLLARAQTAARALIPPAFSDDADLSAHARQNLYLLAHEGHGDTLRSEARAYGVQAASAVEQLLATPCEALLPAQLPKLPSWLVLPRLPRLLLASSGRAVPLANLPDALMPLALSKGGLTYAGLDTLQASTNADSLARLMLGLLEQWLENGMPPKERWILELQGRFGDDANARALAPRIREWRAQLDRVRSYEGLELLAQIGSDTALMLLSTFCEQKRYSDLQERAAKALARVADERGLTLEQLADRTVPTLGLDERGLLSLDFGPRQFTISLGSDLTPQIQDAQGVRLKDLPKPGAKDDADKSKAAVAAWKEFKKQAKLVASTQTVRLEAAMCAQRRWPSTEYLALLVRHPVMRSLCQRLVWAAIDAEGSLTHTFRVCEDLSLADIDDMAFELEVEHDVVLPHTLMLEDSQRSQWIDLLADYEILQPFEQLARQTFGLTSDELVLSHLPRYPGRRLSTGSLLGLEQRGWKRRVGGDAIISSLEKPLGNEQLVTLSFGPGWFVGGAPTVDEAQEIESICLSRVVPAGTRDGDTHRAPVWSDLSPIPLSEMLRDLEKIAWHQRD